MDRFNTERLSIFSWRPILEEHSDRQELEAALPAILTPRALEHLPPALQLSQNNGGISSWVDQRAEESDVLLVKSRHDNELVGLLILASDPSEMLTPEIHVGYLLGEASWGQGIATELIQGLVYAAGKDGPAKLFGGVSNDNPASARVLQKAGFEFSPELSSPDSQMYFKTVG